MNAVTYWIAGFAACAVLAVCLIWTCDSGARAESTAALPALMLPATNANGEIVVEKLERSDDDWRKRLTDEQYRVLRGKGTEAAGTGALLHNKNAGIYKCAGCGLALFESDGKFDSGCGWPSFFKPLEGAHITETRDGSHGMTRTEITCSRCDGHLGHVFTEGPGPTGLRYCVNSVSIGFDAAEDGDDTEAGDTETGDAEKSDR